MTYPMTSPSQNNLQATARAAPVQRGISRGHSLAAISVNAASSPRRGISRCNSNASCVSMNCSSLRHQHATSRAEPSKRGVSRNNSFDVQLLRCGFLPSNSVSHFDVEDLQDLDIDEAKIESHDGEKDDETNAEKQAPPHVKIYSLHGMSMSAALQEGRRVAISRLRQLSANDNDNDNGVALTKSSRDECGAPKCTPLRRTQSALLPRQRMNARVPKRRQALAKRSAVAA